MADISDTKTASGGACHKCGCTGKNPGYEKLNKEEVDIEFKLLSPGL
jgi:hypothetical protein